MSAEPDGLNMISRLPRRRVVFAWDMHYACNYRCPYCFYTVAGWEELAKRCVYKTAAEWSEVWGRIAARYGRCQLRITAGEPFAYPDFVEVVTAVTKLHDVQITTNGSLPKAVADFASRIDPARAELDCTIHPLVGDFRVFTDNVNLLRAKGFVANVCYLAYPGQTAQMLDFKRRFAENNIRMNLAVFWGQYQGREYPHAYTDEEKSWIRSVSGRDIGPETVGLDPIPVNGKLCGAGQCYAVVQADGRVYRCGQLCREGQSLGSIFDPAFELHQAPAPCSADYCRCKEYQSAWEQADAQALDCNGVVQA
jgi:MoaA/NifB/PqqE/SkfB family radical SAM enzyme